MDKHPYLQAIENVRREYPEPRDAIEAGLMGAFFAGIVLGAFAGLARIDIDHSAPAVGIICITAFCVPFFHFRKLHQEFSRRVSMEEQRIARQRRETQHRQQDDGGTAEPPATPEPTTSSSNHTDDLSKLSADRLKEAILLGTQMAESEALQMLRNKARRASQKKD